MYLSAYLPRPLLAALVLIPGCAQERQIQTVPGPEAHDLLGQVHGTIVITKPVGGLEAIQLPSLEISTPRLPNSGKRPAHNVSGPGPDGGVVFLENGRRNSPHSLKQLQWSNGAETTVFEAPGDLLWDHAAGDALALGPKGDKVAFVARCDAVQLRNPSAYRMEGELEVWSIAKRKRIHALHGVLDDLIAWFPDGQHLAYTALTDPQVAREVQGRHVAPNEDFGKSTENWKRIPVVYILDLDTGKSEPLHAGERPVLSPTGQTLLVRDFALNWRLLDIASNESMPFTAPGAIYPGAIAFAGPNTVLYWAWPTEGTTIESTTNNSPLVGKKQMRTLKLVDLRDARFQTVVPAIDPRRDVSFSPWVPN